MRFLLSALLISSACFSKTIKVAVIDTGIDLNQVSIPLCKTGHADFTIRDVPHDLRQAAIPLMDDHGHGTHISDTIDQYVKGFVREDYMRSGNRLAGHIDLDHLNKDYDYCQIIIKYYRQSGTSKQNIENMIDSLKHILTLDDVSFVNISGGGNEISIEEKKVVKEILDKGIKIVAAAGNNGAIIDRTTFGYYPALYDDRIYVVGNKWKDRNGNLFRSPTSNYGVFVKHWEVGTSVWALHPTKHQTVNGKIVNRNTNLVVSRTGTSMAAAIKTGKLVREMLKK